MKSFKVLFAVIAFSLIGNSFASELTQPTGKGEDKGKVAQTTNKEDEKKDVAPSISEKAKVHFKAIPTYFRNCVTFKYLHDNYGMKKEWMDANLFWGVTKGHVVEALTVITLAAAVFGIYKAFFAKNAPVDAEDEEITEEQEA
jgi:hypothetical protein